MCRYIAELWGVEPLSVWNIHSPLNTDAKLYGTLIRMS